MIDIIYILFHSFTNVHTFLIVYKTQRNTEKKSGKREGELSPELFDYLRLPSPLFSLFSIYVEYIRVLCFNSIFENA